MLFKYLFRDLCYAKAVELLNESNACIIDINMGCPTPKITKNGEGSALMLQPSLVGEIVREVSKASKKPVTVKIRKGWDDTKVMLLKLPKLLKKMELRQLQFMEEPGAVLQGRQIGK